MPHPDGFNGKLYQIFKEEIISIPYNIEEKIKAERILPNLFYEASVTLIPTPEKDINRRVPLISDSDRRVPADWGQESQAFRKNPGLLD